MTNVRAWDFHAGLRSRGAVADFDFESLAVPTTVHLGAPRVALIAGQFADYTEAAKNGLRGHLSRRESCARAPREPRLRPRIRLVVP